jgi:hypothetical protein
MSRAGTFSDYFSTGVNTGNGLSMLLIPRGEGVETKIIKSSCTFGSMSRFLALLFCR